MSRFFNGGTFGHSGYFKNSSFDPLSIQDLQFYGIASDSRNTITSGRISALYNLAEVVGNATERDTNKGPLLINTGSDTINGVPTMKFDSSNLEGLDLNSTAAKTMSNNRPGGAIVVVGKNFGGTNASLMKIEDSGWVHRQTLYYQFGLQTASKRLESDTTTFFSGPIMTDPVIVIANFDYANQTLTIVSDDQIVSTTPTNWNGIGSSSATDSAHVTIGYDTAGSYVNGLIAEILYFNRGLTTEEIEYLRTGFKNKYQLF